MINAIVTIYDDDKELYKSLIEPSGYYYNPKTMEHEYRFGFQFVKKDIDAMIMEMRKYE